METNPYKPPTAFLAVDSAPNDELNTRELYNKVLIFRGRMGRIRYLYTTVAGLVMALIMIMFWGRLSPFLMVPATIYYGVKVPWVFAASSVRRVQDLGKPAVWAWFALPCYRLCSSGWPLRRVKISRTAMVSRFLNPPNGNIQG